MTEHKSIFNTFIAKSDLVGKTIASHELATDGEWLKITFDDGTNITLEPEGDCCSYTWIESIDDPSALVGKIIDIEDLAMPDLGPIGTAKCQEVKEVAYYGTKITTDHGRCVIDFRNNSNGYYGGWLNVKYGDPA